MSLRTSEKLLSIAQRIYFEKLGGKFKAKSLKNIIDHLYVYFEKIAINFDVLSELYIRLFLEIIDKEVRMANISKDDVILVMTSNTPPFDLSVSF